jgi:hypothetical protein
MPGDPLNVPLQMRLNRDDGPENVPGGGSQMSGTPGASTVTVDPDTKTATGAPVAVALPV